MRDGALTCPHCGMPEAEHLALALEARMEGMDDDQIVALNVGALRYLITPALESAAAMVAAKH